jgi:sugar phosphate isomerase/epimerase
MQENIFISTTFAQDNTPISQVLKLCKKAGITNIELGSNHSHEQNYQEMVKKFNFNYLVHNYFPIPKESFVVNVASLNDLIYNKSINHIKKCIDFCQKIGAKLYTFHPGFLNDPKGPNKDSDNYDFQFQTSTDLSNQYELSFQRMILATKNLVIYAHKKDVKIAIETEGSISKKNFLLMQTPNEYKRFIKIFKPSDIGINLNLGHLILASKAFNFEMDNLVNIISNYIVAMELSHNYQVNDDHLPIKAGEWYWKYINDQRFKNAFKIIETRHTSIATIKETLKLF